MDLKDTKKTKKHIPTHVAIICDGNRRWAKDHGWEVFRGHEYAVKKVFEPLIDHAQELGVKYITFWVFSTENWNRSSKEVAFLMELFRNFFTRQMQDLHKKNIRVNMIGDISGFAQDIQEKIRSGMLETKDNTGIVVTLAMNYGGRDEITRAVKHIAKKVKSGEIEPTSISKELISEHLDTSGFHILDAPQLPDPELIVRTSGEQRMSGFLSWQHEYAEFVFPDFSFPEFTPQKLDELLDDFSNRSRRFGK